MNSDMRDIILKRDGKCVYCGSKKQPTVQHVYGREVKSEGAPDERYHMVVRLCRPCHWLVDRGSSASDEIMEKKREIRAYQEAYAARWEGKETPEYIAAYALERADYERREARKKVAASKHRKKSQEKAGGSPLKKSYAKVKASRMGKVGKWANLPGAPRQKLH